MKITLAFDVYGTLIDTAGITSALNKHLGDQAAGFSRLWREKQLEYSFRRGLMQNYRDFSVCTKNALDYACQYFQAEITATEKQNLMDEYRVLPPFSDVEEGLSKLKSSVFRMFAFSNGRAQEVISLLKNANVYHFFEDVISVDEVRSFKPNPAVYSHFLRRSEAVRSETWLISSNPFDVIGAISAGISAAWIKRSAEAIFDPWEIKPTMVVNGLLDLYEALSRMDKNPNKLF